MRAPEEDMSSMDFGEDMRAGIEPDMRMEQEPWPMYSGQGCDVDGVDGICLPTSRCPGQSVPGHCPGPSDMRCCLQMCDPGGGEPGRCTLASACSDWAPSAQCPGPAQTSGCCRLPEGGGTSIGTLWNTYYYLAVEQNYPGTKDTTLYDSSCQPLVDVSANFSDAACIEGSARLSDGRVINYATTCSCGRPCPTGGTVCYSILDAQSFPWGKGARSNPLEPLRSLAVDRSTISLGTVIYLEEWDGVQIPTVGGLGGFSHDGCFRADDVGGAIQGGHIDIFAGSEAMWQALEGIFPTNSQFMATAGAPRCAYLKR